MYPTAPGVVGLSLSSRTERGYVIAALSGELDIAAAPMLREKLHGLLGPGASRLIIDLSAVSYAVTAAGAPSSSSRARASLSAASRSRRARAFMGSPLLCPGRRRSGPAARIGRRQHPPDARHREHHKHGDDGAQADEDHGLLLSVTPGIAGRRLLPGAYL
jgi:STAS domain-containing protein